MCLRYYQGKRWKDAGLGGRSVKVYEETDGRFRRNGTTQFARPLREHHHAVASTGQRPAAMPAFLSIHRNPGSLKMKRAREIIMVDVAFQPNGYRPYRPRTQTLQFTGRAKRKHGAFLMTLPLIL